MNMARKPKKRVSDWSADISAVTQLYLHDADVRRWVDQAVTEPLVYHSWGNRDLPVKVMRAAGDLSVLLVEPDPVTVRSANRFLRTTFTYYPSPFLLDYGKDIQAGAAWAGNTK